MPNPWSSDDQNSDHVTLERITLSSLKVADDASSADIQQFVDLLKDDTLSAEEVLEQVAERLEQAGRYEDALSILPKDLLKRADSLPPRTLAKVWYRYASLNRWTGNTPRAIWCATNSLHLYTELGDRAGTGEAHALIGYCYWMIDEYAIAHDHLTAAWKAFEACDDKRSLANVAWNSAVVNHLEGRLDEAREFCRRGLDLLAAFESPSLADHLLSGKLWNTLALVDSEEGHNQAAVANYRQAITCWSQSRDTILPALGYANLAASEIAVGAWKQAEQSLQTARGLAAGQSPQTDCMILNTLAALELRQGKFPEAEEHARKSVEAAVEAGIKSSEALGWETLGEVFHARGRAREAVANFRHSLRLTTKIGRRINLPGLYLRLAEASLDLGEEQNAVDALDKADDLLKDYPKLHMSGFSARIRGKLAISRGEVSEGLTKFAQAVSIFESISHVYESGVGHLEIGAVLSRLDPIRALNHLETANRLFLDLGARPKQVRAAELLSALLKAMPQPKPSVAPTLDDAVLVERLNTAAKSHELLLRELAAILHNHLRAGVLIFELFSDDSISPIVNHGFPAKDVEKAGKTLHAFVFQRRTLPENVRVQFIEDGSHASQADPQRRFWVFMQGDELARKSNFTDSVLKIAAMGLEICRLRAMIQSMRKTVSRQVTGSFASLVGLVFESPSMREVIQQIQKIRSSDATVLITGESGVGKELVARAIHSTSNRHTKPFLPFNCASIPPDLVESRLFGHTKGAFTGADRDTVGVIRAAAGGTLFLDEIGELTLSVQPKLLRFLQEREIHALGDSLPMRVDVRLLAATNRDLAEEAERGNFREDLYHRLNVIRIHVPPLRERKEDIPLLARYVLAEYNKKERKAVVFSEAALDMLCEHGWPGNVRQLKNEIERAVVMAETDAVLMPQDFSPEVRQRTAPLGTSGKHAAVVPGPPVKLSEALEEVERKVISEALQRHGGNISRVARELDISRNGLILKCKRLGLDHHE